MSASTLGLLVDDDELYLRTCSAAWPARDWKRRPRRMPPARWHWPASIRRRSR